FLCNICFSESKIEDMVFPTQKSCNHIFCNTCIQQYLKNLIQQNQILNISCPQYGCEQKLNEKDIKRCLQNEEFFQKYIKFKQIMQLNSDPDIRWCIGIGCENPIKGEKGQIQLTCNKCGLQMCYFCTNLWHEDLDCESAIDSEYKIIIQKFQVKNCPQCLSRIQKSEGCNHMKCPRCSHQFCWLCLKKYTTSHYNQSNIFGCPGLQFAQVIPYLHIYKVILYYLLTYFGFFLHWAGFMLVLPLLCVIFGLGILNFLYFYLKHKSYTGYICSDILSFKEIFKFFFILIISVLTIPINLCILLMLGFFLLIKKIFLK
ncbi:ibr domain protein, partial [Ichthyophthirius multifiliis]